jgi:pilus assembly protein CpaE
MNASDIDLAPSATSRKTSVVICDTGAGGVDEIAAIVAGGPDQRAQIVPAEGLHNFVGAADPDVVILDIKGEAGSELDHLTAVRGRFGDTPVIIVSELGGDQILRGLLRHRVQDWQRRPLVPGDLLAAIGASVRSARAGQNRVHAVISASAGAGGTTVALTLADVLARRQGKGKGTVGLFDLDFASGDCGLRLNLSTTARLESAITAPARIDAEFVSLIQQKHASGLGLYSFKRREFVTHLNVYEMVLRLLDVVTLEHAQTVLDLPAYHTDWEADVLAAVNTITLVCEMNVVSIRHALDVLRMITTLPGGPRSVTVLVNKVERGLFGSQRIPKARLKELFGETPFVQLPADPTTLSEAIDRGILPREVASRAPFVRAIEGLADSLVPAEAAKAR